MMNNQQRLINIVVTGTPGVGKTSFSALLSDRLNDHLHQSQQQNFNFNVLNLGEMINEGHLYTEWNSEFNVPIFDENMVSNEIEPFINDGGAIIDFHSPGFIPDEWVDLVVLLRCNNTILYDRLKARGYSEKKISENIECEIMEVTADDIKEAFHAEKILELKSEKNEDMEKNLDTVVNAIETIGYFKENNI